MLRLLSKSKKVLALVVVLVGVLLWLKLTLRPSIESSRRSATTQAPLINLRPTEAERITVSEHQIIVTTPTEEKIEFRPTSGISTVSENKDGSIDVHVQEKGFCFQYGMGFMYSDKLRVDFDFQVAYWRRVGLHVGVGLANKPLSVAHLSVSYLLDRIGLENTSVFVGITSSKLPVAGFRVSL